MKGVYKKYLGMLFIMFIINTINAQEEIDDRAIVAHHKRMVFEKWGDFKPKAKRIFGINVNPHYTTVWGWAAPKRNKNYKKGPDIRPLKANGEENKRRLLQELQKKEANHIDKITDSLLQVSYQEYSQINSHLSDADPLYLIYYKKALEPISKYSSMPNDHYDWRLPSDKIFKELKDRGTIDRLDEELSIIKEDLKHAKTLPMERGKRLMLYHETLIKFRTWLERLEHFANATNRYLKTKDSNYSNIKIEGENKNQTDKEIAESVLNKYKTNF